jgi:hypothetical protein
MYSSSYEPRIERFFTLRDMAEIRGIPLFEPDPKKALANSAYAALTKSVQRVILTMTRRDTP